MSASPRPQHPCGGQSFDDELDVQVRMKFAHVCDGVQRLSGKAHVSGDSDPALGLVRRSTPSFQTEDLLRDGHQSRSCRGQRTAWVERSKSVARAPSPVVRPDG
ncbi:unnamed protein product, partial [Mesorhabditis spiculigera]